MYEIIFKDIILVSTFVGFAGIVSLFNALKAVQWKRAELAGLYLREFYSDPEVAFACRSLEWPGGRLVVPDCLQPLLPTEQKVIDHDFEMLVLSMEEYIDVDAFDREPRMQI